MIEKRILRALLLKVLSQTPQTQIVEATNNVERLIAEQGLFPSKGDCEGSGSEDNYNHYYVYKKLSRDDKTIINEIIWNLLLERVITPGIDAGNRESYCEQWQGPANKS